MTSLYLSHEELEDTNPLDLIENIIVENDWSYDRQGRNEITVGVDGSWCQYHLWFSWRSDLKAVHFSCAYDIKIPDRQYQTIYELLARVNERLAVGHFDSWREEGMVLFRHSLLLGGASEVRSEQFQTLVEIGMKELEKFYPAIQFCIWGGKTPEEAIDAAMFETVGEA